MDNKEKELLLRIKELHSQIQTDGEQSLQKALKLGSILQTQKERVGHGHGNFIMWVKTYLPFSERCLILLITVFTTVDLGDNC